MEKKEYDLENFDWGNTDEWYKRVIGGEFFESNNIYFKFHEPMEGDVVVDVGASVGPFAFSLKNKNINHLYSFEPSLEHLSALVNNSKEVSNTIIPMGISDKNEVIEFERNKVYYSTLNVISTITFKQFINDFQIKQIDFLKTDCEGAEYHIFNDENYHWINNNVKYIVGEWHLSTSRLKENFRQFRDRYLKSMTNHEVFSVDGVNIKWDLWNEHFIEYYNEVIIYIDNR